jgi:hypothetical protein
MNAEKEEHRSSSKKKPSQSAGKTIGTQLTGQLVAVCSARGGEGLSVEGASSSEMVTVPLHI